MKNRRCEKEVSERSGTKWNGIERSMVRYRSDVDPLLTGFYWYTSQPALADLRPATVNQCFYEHSLAGTASLQPRLTEPPQPPTRGRPTLVSARTPATLPLCFALASVDSRTATRLSPTRLSKRSTAVSTCHRYIFTVRSERSPLTQGFPLSHSR